MLKLTDNPPILSPWVDSLTELTGRWWVAHTKARNEKAFSWDLHDRGIGYFLPMYEKNYISGGKKRSVLKPVFPSYVFFCGNEEHRRTALTTNRLCQTIAIYDQEQIIRELFYFELALDHAIPLSPIANINPGQICRVISGSLRGVEGMVVRNGNISNFYLRVSIIGGAATLEIDAGLLEPI